MDGAYDNPGNLYKQEPFIKRIPGMLMGNGSSIDTEIFFFDGVYVQDIGSARTYNLLLK
jgi:hypothetical protein